MRILAMTRAHNAGRTLAATLDSLAVFSDDIYVIDDRSTDDTAEILANHPAVTNVVRARPDLPPTPWLIPESAGLELLYRMADFCRPDWVMMVDADWLVETDIDLRAVLARTPDDIVALMCPMVSRWDDPEYPDLIPVMGTAEALRGPLWRWYPGLRAGGKLMHNPHWPANITDHGRIGQLPGVRLVHSGWSTLAERILRVEHYLRLDPDYRFNFGVAYDRSLLFGYALDEVDLLKADYRRRIRGDFDPLEPGGRLPIDREPRDRPRVRSARGWFPSRCRLRHRSGNTRLRGRFRGRQRDRRGRWPGVADDRTLRARRCLCISARGRGPPCPW